MTSSKLVSYTTPMITVAAALCVPACGPGDNGGSGAATESGGSASASATAGSATSATSGSATTGSGTGSASGSATSGSGTGSSSGGSATTGGGPKFDVGIDSDVGDIGGPGSCRPSETYGAAGNFPTFQDPAFAPFLGKQIAIVTHRKQSGAGPNVMTIVDISGPPPPPGVNYDAPRYWDPQWTETELGRIFGLTLDSDGNIYVAATTVYGAIAAPDKIRKIDGVTGQITDFATLPNNGPAFGNLNYDCVSETIYVSNHEDGYIYQLDMNGNVVSAYHHATQTVTMGQPNTPGEPDGQFAPRGERVWAVQSHAGRLYYSVWVEDAGTIDPARDNEIWSVAYVDQSGVPDPATAKKEFDVPKNDATKSLPVSDLSFAHNGWMLIAQRTMYGDMQTSAHQSTTYDYQYMNGQWVWQGTNYVVGELMPYSAAGGVDHDFVEDGYVWMTGDALDFYTPNVVYGLQGTPNGGGDITNSTIIDLDGEITQQDKTVYGDVEVPIPGDVTPVPPPG